MGASARPGCRAARPDRDRRSRCRQARQAGSGCAPRRYAGRRDTAMRFPSARRRTPSVAWRRRRWATGTFRPTEAIRRRRCSFGPTPRVPRDRNSRRITARKAAAGRSRLRATWMYRRLILWRPGVGRLRDVPCDYAGTSTEAAGSDAGGRRADLGSGQDGHTRTSGSTGCGRMGRWPPRTSTTRSAGWIRRMRRSE